MGTLVNKASKSVKSNQVVNRTFEESCKAVFTVEEFCKEMGVDKIDVKVNPQVINKKTGQNNLFLVFGDQTGAVSEKVQRAYLEEGKVPDRPMIGLFETEGGEEVYTLFNQGGGESVFSLGLSD